MTTLLAVQDKDTAYLMADSCVTHMSGNEQVGRTTETPDKSGKVLKIGDLLLAYPGSHLIRAVVHHEIPESTFTPPSEQSQLDTWLHNLVNAIRKKLMEHGVKDDYLPNGLLAYKGWLYVVMSKGYLRQLEPGEALGIGSGGKLSQGAYQAITMLYGLRGRPSALVSPQERMRLAIEAAALADNATMLPCHLWVSKPDSVTTPEYKDVQPTGT